MRYTEILEARSNPDKNLRVSMLEQLAQYRGQKDVFVSFTSDVGKASHVANDKSKPRMVKVHYRYRGQKLFAILSTYNNDLRFDLFGVYKEVDGKPQEQSYVPGADEQAVIKNAYKRVLDRRARHASGGKLGIYPKSDFNTPLGVYAYPVDYVLDFSAKKGIIDSDYTGKGEWQFLQVLRLTAPESEILDCENYPESRFKADLDWLKDIVVKGMKVGEAGFNNAVQRGIGGANERTAISQFWNVLNHVSQYARETGGSFSKPSVIWSVLLRKLGYRAVIDMAHMGVIHNNEKTQAVFLDKTAYEHIDTIKRHEPRKARSYDAVDHRSKTLHDAILKGDDDTIRRFDPFDVVTKLNAFEFSIREEIYAIEAFPEKVQHEMVRRILRFRPALALAKSIGVELSLKDQIDFCSRYPRAIDALHKMGYELRKPHAEALAKSHEPEEIWGNLNEFTLDAETFYYIVNTRTFTQLARNGKAKMEAIMKAARAAKRQGHIPEADIDATVQQLSNYWETPLGALRAEFD